MSGFPMRQAILAGSFVLAACGSSSEPAVAEPTDARVPMAVESRMVRLFSVDSVAAVCAGGKLSLQVGATANSGGWGEPLLKRLGTEGGTVSYEVVATPPKGPAVTMMLQMFMMRHEDADAHGITNVRVVALNNEMSAKVSGCAS